MHYSVVRDAALYAAIAVAVTIRDSFSVEKMTACYLAIFLVILFCLEVARDWEERKRDHERFKSYHNSRRQKNDGIS